jgi:hypothetical protein
MDIFRFTMPTPGQPWVLDQEHVDDKIYTESDGVAENFDRLLYKHQLAESCEYQNLSALGGIWSVSDFGLQQEPHHRSGKAGT